MYFGKARIFLILCVAFILGVFLGRFVGLLIAAILAAVFIMLVTLLWPKDLRSLGEGGQRLFMVVGFAGLIMVLGIWRFQQSLPDETAPDFIGQLSGQKVGLVGVVADEPDVRANKTNLVIAADGYEGKLLASVGRYPEYEYGDELKLSGKLEEPFVSEEFSYKDYLSRSDIYAVMSFPKIEKLEQGQGNVVKAALLSVKHKFQKTLSQVLPEPHNAFLLGLILGLKRAIPETLQEAFIITGVSHIVVISGYNISIITRNILKTRAWWGVRAAFYLSLLTVLAFVVLTGAEASVLRAAIMGLTLVVAIRSGRIYYAINALILAAVLMLVINPKILAFDVGFQLSFLATLGLIYLAPVFEKWFWRIPNFLALRSNLASTLAAQLFTLPLLIFYFDRVSLIAPLVNVLILWVIPYVMFFGFFTGLFGMVFLPLGQLLSGIPWVMLEYMIRVVEFFARLPLSSTSAQINVWLMNLYYLVLTLSLIGFRRLKRFYYQLEYYETKL